MLAALSCVGLLVSFPDFNLWPMAWVALVPLMVAVVRRPRVLAAFWLGWATSAVFFYASCYWLTHAMIHFGGIPRPLAYLLLVPAPVIVGLFPALWCAVLAYSCKRWGTRSLAFAPFAWVALEWARFGVTGQLWNAVGYSQAYVPALIQTARWGGVYAVGFLILTVNAAIAYAVLERHRRAFATSALAVGAVALTIYISTLPESLTATSERPSAVVVGVQPNVSVNFGRTPDETAALVAQHLTLSAGALDVASKDLPGWYDGVDVRDAAARDERNREMLALPRVVVWPESPMNFSYAHDAKFRATVSEFAREHDAWVLFNSIEPAPARGVYNSAVLVNQEGRLVAQYDKIRLLPFGEYIPLPRWLPLTWLLGGIVGDFTPGTRYELMPLGKTDGDGARVGVFICFESAFPSVARTFADEGADVLINISNDGYLGQTPVIRQHLANAVFRAVETGRPILRVTNTGISARITPRGEVLEPTGVYQTASRTWVVSRNTGGKTFYTGHGDIFVAFCVAASVLATAFAALSGKLKKQKLHG